MYMHERDSIELQTRLAADTHGAANTDKQDCAAKAKDLKESLPNNRELALLKKHVPTADSPE